MYLVNSSLVYPITLRGRWGTTDDFTAVSFRLVLSSASSVYLFLFSVFLFFLFFCLSPYPVESSWHSCLTAVESFCWARRPWDVPKNTLDSVSWPRSGLRHVSQWLIGSFCEHLRCCHGDCTRCSVAFGSISSQMFPSFSLALPLRSWTHKSTEIWIWQGSASVLPFLSEICCYLPILTSALSELQWLVQALTEIPVSANVRHSIKCSQVLPVSNVPVLEASATMLVLLIELDQKLI